MDWLGSTQGGQHVDEQDHHRDGSRRRPHTLLAAKPGKGGDAHIDRLSEGEVTDPVEAAEVAAQILKRLLIDWTANISGVNNKPPR